MFDRGNGPPVVVVPGLQGRWEWAKPALTRARADMPDDLLHLERRHRLGQHAAARARVRELHPAARRRARTRRAEAGGHLRRVLRRVRGFAIRGAPSRTRLGADPRVRSRSRMAPEPAAGGLDLPALVVDARVPGDVAAAGLAGGERGAAPRRVPAGVPRAPGAALPGGADDSVADGSESHDARPASISTTTAGAFRRRPWSSAARNRSTASCRSESTRSVRRVDSARRLSRPAAHGTHGHPDPALDVRRARE